MPKSFFPLFKNGTLIAITTFFLWCSHQKRLLFGYRPDSTALYAFHVSPDTGALLPVPGSPFSLSPILIAEAHPAGKWIFAVSRHSIVTYSVSDSATGIVIRETSSIASSGTISGMKLEPSGKFLLVTDTATPALKIFAVDSATGTLTSVNQSGTEPMPLALNGLEIHRTQQGAPPLTSLPTI